MFVTLPFNSSVMGEVLESLSHDAISKTTVCVKELLCLQE